MSAMRAERKRENRPPSFQWSEYVDVDVTIDPEDLEREGWVYVGKNKNAPTEDEWVALIQRNHDDEHAGPMRWCQHPLCSATHDKEQTA